MVELNTMSDDQEVIFNSLLADDVDVATSYVASIPEPTTRPSVRRDPYFQSGLLLGTVVMLLIYLLW